jgi:hypothetical protein
MQMSTEKVNISNAAHLLGSIHNGLTAQSSLSSEIDMLSLKVLPKNPALTVVLNVTLLSINHVSDMVSYKRKSYSLSRLRFL